ncbi:MAG: pepsin/retropepsin-like aspartic protease family protein, partial [Planctomycetota bacterium]
ADTVAELHGRLGDALFQAGRFGESIEPLSRGAVGVAAVRRAAFAGLAMVLPYGRKPTGPLSSEQPLLPGDMPEFVCSAGALSRPFAIDTGTSMTTLSRSFAQQLQASGRRPAGSALDGAGRELPVEIGVLPKFAIGDIEFGAVPIAIVDDAALQLRDEHGGPGRVPGGVLGLDLLGTCRLALDPARRSVALEVPRGLPEAESVQCVRAEGRCLVPVFVDDVRLWFVLDTGASHSSLTGPGLLRLPGGADRAMPGFRRVHTVGGSVVAVREVRDLVMRCSFVRFTGVVLPVVERRTTGLFPVHGVLGVDLLARCRVVLDGGRARLVGLP